MEQLKEMTEKQKRWVGNAPTPSWTLGPATVTSTGTGGLNYTYSTPSTSSTSYTASALMAQPTFKQ